MWLQNYSFIGETDSWSAAKDEYKLFRNTCRKDKVRECPFYAGAAQKNGGPLPWDRQETG